jgi:transcriptional regulator with GAF, ATPase, and Fis domain
MTQFQLTTQDTTTRIQIGNEITSQPRNTPLSQAEREQCELAEALCEAGALLAAASGIEAMLDCLLEQIGRLVPHDASNIMLIEGDRAHVVRWRGYDHFNAETFISKYCSQVTRSSIRCQMVETGHPVVIPDRCTHPDWARIPEEMAWLRSYASAPIRSHGDTIGFLNVGSAMPGLFDQSSAERLQALADRAAMALATCRRAP